MEAGQACVKCRLRGGERYGEKRIFRYHDSPPFFSRLCDPCSEEVQKTLQDEFLIFIGDKVRQNGEVKPAAKPVKVKGQHKAAAPPDPF